MAWRRRWPKTSLARRRHAAAIFTQGPGAYAAGRSRSWRPPGRRGKARDRGGRRLGRRPVADRNRRGRRADRSGFVGRAAVVSPVPRARRAGIFAAVVARAMLLLARCGLGDAEKLRAQGPRRDGQGRQGGRDLRVLLVGV